MKGLALKGEPEYKLNERWRTYASGGRKGAVVTEVQAGSSAALVYDGSGIPAVKEFTASGLVEDALYAFKVRAVESCPFVL